MYVGACGFWDDTYNGFRSSSLGVTTLAKSAAHGGAAVDVVSVLLWCMVSAILLSVVDPVPWLCARSTILCGCEQVVGIGCGAGGGEKTTTSGRSEVGCNAS